VDINNYDEGIHEDYNRVGQVVGNIDKQNKAEIAEKKEDRISYEQGQVETGVLFYKGKQV